MQMLAASKLKRAQDATLASRPYVDKLTEMSNTLSYRVENVAAHPFLQRRSDTDKKLLIVIAPDKGLCGGLITNLARELYAISRDKNFLILSVGKKIERHVAKLTNEVVATFPFGTTLPTRDAVFPITNIVEEYYLTSKVNSVHVLSTHFVSIFSQKPILAPLLPLSLDSKNETSTQTLFEPSVSAILNTLLKHYLEMALYQHLLESFVSEQGARMIAMQNATDNAKEIIEELTLSYNKARQAKITSEILDISSSSVYTYA